MLKLLKVLKEGKVRIDLNPYFKSLNDWAVEFFVKGETNQMGDTGRQALREWLFTDCTKGQCETCLFNEEQSWIKEMPFKDINTLCDLMCSIMGNQKLERKNITPVELVWEVFKADNPMTLG